MVDAGRPLATEDLALPDVVAVDDHLLVLNKPAHLLSVPGKGPEGADCLSARVQARWPDALIVHRLDMGTSGLMVMARGPEHQRRLSQAFAQRLTHKRYEAVVAGVVDEARHPLDSQGWHTMDWPLIADWPNRPRSKVCPIHGKPSLTRWQVLGHTQLSGLDCTRLLLEPVTGRSHQLRVHLMTLGHPIVGDGLYAHGATRMASGRLLLHATHLSLPHPDTGERVAWDLPPPF